MFSILIPFLFQLESTNGVEKKGSEHEIENIVVIASKKKQSLENLSKAISVVSKEELLEKNQTLLPDLLRDEAGVYIQQTTPGQGIPIIRGLKGSENVHLIDGMRLNTAFFRNSPNQYLALVDPFMTEQIEIIRGPASVLYGGDALGGVLNILTHTPEFSSHENSFNGNLFFSYDSADQKSLSHLQFDVANEKIATSFGLSYQDTGSRRVGGGQRLPFTSYTSKAFNNKWVFAVSESSLLTFDMQYLIQPSTPRVDDLIAGYGQIQPDSSLFLFSPNERQFSHLTYKQNAPYSFYDSASYDFAWQQIKDHRIKSAFDSDTIKKEQNQSSLYSFQANFTKAAHEKLDMVYGIDFYHDTISSAKQELLNSQTTNVEPRFPDLSTMQHIGFYLDNTIFLNNYDLTIGIRYSDYKINLNNSEIQHDQLVIDDLTWHSGWLYHLSDQNKLFANLGRGFRPPNIFDLGQVGDRPGNRFNVINTNVKPETVFTLDFGWKHFGRQWFAEFAVFYSKYYDKIASVETGELTDQGQIIVQSQNLNKVILYGFESNLKYITNADAEIKAVLNYTWGEESLNNFNEPADRIPPLNGFISYKKQLSQNLCINPKISFSREQNRLSDRDIRDSRINPSGTNGFVTFNTYLNWKINPTSTLRFGIENILDKNYREHGSGLDAAGRNFHFSFDALF